MLKNSKTLITELTHDVKLKNSLLNLKVRFYCFAKSSKSLIKLIKIIEQC